MFRDRYLRTAVTLLLLVAVASEALASPVAATQADCRSQYSMSGRRAQEGRAAHRSCCCAPGQMQACRCRTRPELPVSTLPAREVLPTKWIEPPVWASDLNPGDEHATLRLAVRRDWSVAERSSWQSLYCIWLI